MQTLGVSAPTHETSMTSTKILGKTYKILMTWEAILGQFAILADRGWTLPRVNPDSDSKENRDNEEDAKQGLLKLYRDITKKKGRRGMCWFGTAVKNTLGF